MTTPVVGLTLVRTVASRGDDGHGGGFDHAVRIAVVGEDADRQGGVLVRSRRIVGGHRRMIEHGSADVDDDAIGGEVVVATLAVDQMQDDVSADNRHARAGGAIGIGRLTEPEVVPVGRVIGRCRAVLVVIGDLGDV